MPGAERLGGLSRWPIVVSPMAGGPSTPALAVAAAEAGALPFLAGGYKSAAALKEEMTSVRVATDAAFGVNVFVPGQPTRQAEALSAYLAALEAEAGALGVALGAAEWDDDAFDAKVELLLADPPPVVSFTFGSPPVEVLRELTSAGALVAVTVTTLDEADLALAAGAGCLCLQGAEAGAHRGSFVNDDRPGQDVPLLVLLGKVRRRTDVPLIAAGGIAGPGDVAEALAAGATAVQAGTAFLRCPESGASPAHQRALVDPRFSTTALTRAFSGRRARSLVNRLLRDNEGAPAAYPEINNATRPLRAAATAADDPDRMSLYAGVNSRRAAARPAGDVVSYLASGVPGRPGSP